MNNIKEYFLCARPHTFPAAISPIVLGSVVSIKYIANFSWLKFFIFFIICILLQSATNYFNEYYDYKKGLDKIDSEGISGSIIKGNISSHLVFKTAVLLYFFALVLGIYLSFITNYKLLILGLISMFAGYFYTGGKYPIAYGPFGEIVAGFFMGTVIVSVAFFIQTNFINKEILVISSPIFILVSAILLSNNIRDLDNDKDCGRKTYAIIVGRDMAIETLTAMFFIVYMLNLVFMFSSYGNFFNVLVLPTISLSLKIIKGFKNNFDKKNMAPFMIMTAKLTILISFLMSLAYLLNYKFF